MEQIFQGIAVSPGYAFGNVQILKPTVLVPFESTISADNIDREIDRIIQGIEQCREYLQRLIEGAFRQGKTVAGEILAAHQEILLDDELFKDIARAIRNELYSAPAAVGFVFDEISAEIATLDDEYARQRADDFRQIKNLLLRAVQGMELDMPHVLRFSQTILVGNDLTPADTAMLEKSQLAGLISETGGITSHIAIFSQSLAIPAVVGLRGVLAELTDGESIILDGCTGKVIVSPETDTINDYKKKQVEYEKSLQLLEQLRNVPACTKNGRQIHLSANIGNAWDVDAAIKYGAEGVGLFRTEFLFMDRQGLPTEEEQFRAYRKVAEAMSGKPVTIRTLDIGGDKPIPGLSFPAEANPFLGWRACRIYQQHPELIFPQLRAILRAAQYGDIRVMFPMIISREEVLQMLDLLEQAKRQLTAEGVRFCADLSSGIMIETPAAALLINELLPLVDFCSIGTNDLTQYTLAVDRGNELVSALYDPMHPAVLKLISDVVAASHKLGKHISLCGELAGNECAIPFFLENHLENLSMTPARIPVIKNCVICATSPTL